ncbi:AAA family ATPase [Candidatus Micrarchaeota archaeon]|nr:AAA family ATPase [Candidatus Micrarchaeota archaeon]
MPENIFSRKKKIHEIFRDERVLYPEFLPESLPHREKEIEALSFCFKPVLLGKKPVNAVVVGSPGTGKTVSSKFVFSQLEEFSGRAKSLYVNCFEFSSRNAVLFLLANFVGAAIPRRGLATDEIYSRMLEHLKKADFIPIIVLDEADQLISKEDGSKLLYDLLRVTETEKILLGLVLISNDFDLTSSLDSRVKSSLSPESIVFEKYYPAELKDILNERAEFAFMDNVLEKDVINVAAAHSAKLGGDARIGIESLLKAGRIAEKENSDKVSLVYLRQAFSSMDSALLSKALPFLSEQEKIILELISSFNGVFSGKLYEKYSKTKEHLELRSFRSTISKLESMNLISAPLIEVKPKGKSKFISLKIPKEALQKFLKEKVK